MWKPIETALRNGVYYGFCGIEYKSPSEWHESLE